MNSNETRMIDQIETEYVMTGKIKDGEILYQTQGLGTNPSVTDSFEMCPLVSCRVLSIKGNMKVFIDKRIMKTDKAINEADIAAGIRYSVIICDKVYDYLIPRSTILDNRNLEMQTTFERSYRSNHLDISPLSRLRVAYYDKVFPADFLTGSLELRFNVLVRRPIH